MWISQLLFWMRQMFYKVIIINKPLERFIFPDLQCQGFFLTPQGESKWKWKFLFFTIPTHLVPSSPFHPKFSHQLHPLVYSWTHSILAAAWPGKQEWLSFIFCSIPAHSLLGLIFAPLISVVSEQPTNTVNSSHSEEFYLDETSKIPQNQENSLKSTKEKLQPGPRMVWAERDLKDLPVCPFYSSHRREFIRDKKNTQLLIMSDGFSFQLRACHLASNPEKADRERNTTVLGWEELFTRIAPSAQKCCIFHLCGEKKKWSEKNPPQNSVTLLEKRAAVFSHRCLEQTKVEADD